MSERVMIFVPSPLLTVTVEQPADELELHLHAGGQGIWQARMIKSFGVPVTVVTAVGGEVGRVLEPLLAAEGADLRVVSRRTANGWYVHDRRKGGRDNIAESNGAPLERHEVDEIYGLALAEGLDAAVSILSGPAHPSVVPSDIYRRLGADLVRNGGRVVADLSGNLLASVLGGGVCFLKINNEEAVEAGWASDDTIPELVRAMRKLRDAGADAVVVSRADQPALALLDDTAYEIEALRLEAVDPRGGGDSMTAGVASVLATGGDMETAVRTGAAAGALNVTRHGLGTGRAEVVGKLLDRVRLKPLPPAMNAA